MGLSRPCLPWQGLHGDCSEPWGRRAEFFACQLCSAQPFAFPGNFGSALFILKLVIECVQGVRMGLGWPVSTSHRPGRRVPFSRSDSGQGAGSRERGLSK